MKYIDEANIDHKKVLIRCDLNVPIEDGVITDDSRIKKSIKTIEYLLARHCSVIIMSHLGRIKVSEDKEKNTLKDVAPILEKYLGRNVTFVSSPVGKDALLTCKNMKEEDVILLENTRFCDFPEKLESSNDLELAKYWASFADVFVCDAFGSLHRAHASVAGIANYLPTYFGFLVKDEMESLKPVVKDIAHPFGVFMGGAKVDDKLKYIKDILPRCDYLLLGGGIANSFLYALDYDIGDSLCTSDEITLGELRKLYEENKGKIILPVDFVFEDSKIMDLGEKSIARYTKCLSLCKTIFVNGTCGKFEDKKYALGTYNLFNNLKNVDAYKVAGGGDTLNFINSYHVINSFDYLSSGGGASLEYVSSSFLEAVKYIESVNK